MSDPRKLEQRQRVARGEPQQRAGRVVAATSPRRVSPAAPRWPRRRAGSTRPASGTAVAVESAARRSVPRRAWPRGSASSRRAANTSASAETVSSQWASSIRHSSGSCSAAAASRPERADVDREALGAAPAASIASAARSAAACGAGSSSRCPSTGAQQLVQAGAGQLRLGLHADGAQHPEAVVPCSHGPLEQGGLADARLAPQHERARVPVACRVEQGAEAIELGRCGRRAWPSVLRSHGP